MASSFVSMLNSERNVFIHFSILLSVPSAVLYCTQVWVILRHRQFYNAFYALFVARAIMDLLGMLNSFYGYRLPCLLGYWLQSFYEQLPSWAIAAYFFFCYFGFHGENLAMNFILLNRLTAIAIPLSHEKLWNKCLPIALVAIFVVPIGFSFFLFNMDAVLLPIPSDPLNGNRTSFILFEGPETHYLLDNTIVCCISAVVFLLSSILINVAIYVAYKYRHKLMEKQQIRLHGVAQSGPRKKSVVMESIEKRLLLYAIVSFIGHLLGTLFLRLHCTFTGDYVTMSVLFAQAPWITDVVTIVAPSWMLLWASSQFRQQWAKDVLSQKVCLLMAARNKQNKIQVTHVNMQPFSRRPTVTCQQLQSNIVPLSFP